MRNEFAPFNVKVVTVITGAVKSNLIDNIAVIHVPESSPYFPIREAIEKRTFLAGDKDMPGEEYAKRVVNDLLRGPRPLLWRGTFATLVWFMWCFAWVGMLVSPKCFDLSYSITTNFFQLQVQNPKSG
jgi:1-acylglycerone phosphate reductase